MSRRSLIVLVNLVLLTFACQYASAATMPISGMQLGQVIKIGSRQFVKISAENDFMALQTPVRTMQEFTTTACASYPTPSGTNYTAVGNLIDARDGKSYEVRKFADGKCWMVDNLAYGGATDACANKITFSGNGSSTATNRFGTSTYGDCRDPAAGGTCAAGDCNYCVTGVGAGKCGYYYNWQAVVQNASTYYNNDYQPTEPTHGICPSGWHVPRGGAAGEFQTLNTVTSATYAFWHAGGNWKGVYSGSCSDPGGISFQGTDAHWWSSTQVSATNSYRLYIWWHLCAASAKRLEVLRASRPLHQGLTPHIFQYNALF